MAAPAFRASANTAAGNATSRTVTKPTGTVDDDILIAHLYVETDGTITVPGGWTQKDLQEQNGGGVEFRHYVYWKRASSEPPDWTWSWPGSIFSQASVQAYSGAITSGDPFDDTDGAVSPSSTSSAPNVAVTTTVVDTLLVYCSQTFAGSTFSAHTSPITERIDIGQMCVGDGAQASAGASGNKTCTWSFTDDGTAWLGALKPPAVGGLSIPVAMHHYTKNIGASSGS